MTELNKVLDLVKAQRQAIDFLSGQRAALSEELIALRGMYETASRAYEATVVDVAALQALLAEVLPHIDDWHFPVTLRERIEAALPEILRTDPRSLEEPPEALAEAPGSNC